MNSIPGIAPRDAKTMLDEQNGAVLIDVRTQAEYASGHAPGSLNIPIFDLDASGAPAMNTEFVRVVRAHVPIDAKVILACRVGDRSANAAAMLAEAGYGNVFNLTGGIHGRRAWTGQLQEPGWTDEGLPLSETPDPATMYPALAQAAEGSRSS